ncbi:hypothetical protein OIU80_16370 [Flavobacterium sp. LS1R47]|jgi:hypothetical protein|uniref:Uncharacterized protein n=1 Tax=Flavobacterium frigoritolerans TaxID=2987686 RepID=A0A9X3HM09_9FLAO|nr:hypothetical protein [Flavobacterium frigoritolerans]MCV9933860.1 hypothetical protein [Flavobacterium frigoritolerans]
MDRINITPFIGTELYKLGMTFEETKKSLNDNDIQIIENKKGKKIIDGIVSMKFVDDKLSEFSILENSQVFFENLEVFTNTFHETLKQKYDSVYKYGFLIFNQIGIALSGYVDKEEQKTITVYSKGAWNHIL